jgi:hypothetical protein
MSHQQARPGRKDRLTCRVCSHGRGRIPRSHAARTNIFRSTLGLRALDTLTLRCFLVLCSRVNEGHSWRLWARKCDPAYSPGRLALHAYYCGSGSGGSGTGGVGNGGAEPTCGYVDQACCTGDVCHVNATVCSADDQCVVCGDTDQACCKELDTRTLSAGEQDGMCTSHYPVCGVDGLCLACGKDGEACCANSRCLDGCCAGGVCGTNGTSCGENLGTCTDGVCANCGAEEGAPCCDGSCGPYLACHADGICACGSEGEICCDSASKCDAGLDCIGYVCQSGGTTECPATAPLQGDSCDYVGTEICKYPGSAPFVYNCLCEPYGWSCAQ